MTDTSKEAVERITTNLRMRSYKSDCSDAADLIDALAQRCADLEARAERAEAELQRQYDENVHRIAEQARAEAERDAIAAAAFEAAAQVCEEYPRAAPDENEWPHYDDQISHSQACIRTLTPADALSALAARDAAKVAEGMQRAADLMDDSMTIAGARRVILAAIQKEPTQ